MTGVARKVASRRLRRQLAGAVGALALAGVASAQGAKQAAAPTTPAMTAPLSPPEGRVQRVLDQLTTEEKVALLHGSFASGGVPRLGIKPLLMADGPVGVRLNFDTPVKRSTALPATLALAATWDRALAREYGGVLAAEMLALDRHVLFAPGINLMRDPRGGRNFEYMGEDPFLTAELGVAYVDGLQRKGVAATLKHYVANEAERFRHYTDSVVDPVALNEVYLYPFFRALRAGAWALMTSNNATNGRHMGENRDLVRSLLRDRMGWDGVVLTDWRSAYRVEESAPAGIDMTLGLSNYVYGDHLADFVRSGAWPMPALDAQARNVLRLYDRVGLLGGGARAKGEIATPAHARFARQLVAASSTLLKNDGLLPYAGRGAVVVTGPGAEQVMFGGGSGNVNKGEGNVSLLAGLSEALGADRVLRAMPQGTAPELVVYAVTGVSQHEDRDQPAIALDAQQIAEIRALAATTDQLLLVVQTGSAVDLSPVADLADATLVTWFGGQEFGRGVADVLLGKAEPQGRLPVTLAPLDRFPAEMAGSWPALLTRDEHPGGGEAKVPTVGNLRFPTLAYRADYQEGLLVGYRWFDKRRLPVTYPFGFGLGYTRFDLSDLTVAPTDEGVRFTVRLANVGARDGTAVVQLYAAQPGAQGDRPDRMLRGFAKATVRRGGQGSATIDVPWRSLARYDAASRRWIADAGDYRVQVGFSSRDLPLETVVRLPAPLSFDFP